MHKRLLLYVILCGILPTLQAQRLSENTTVRSVLFQLPGEGSYIETAFMAGANALHHEPVKPRGFDAGVEVEIVISDAGKVLNFDKYMLHAPVIYDTNKVDFSIFDQKRLFITNASVSVEVTIRDIYDSTNVFTHTEAFLAFDNTSVQISDLQLIDTYKRSTANDDFTRNGYRMEPYTINFYPSTRNNIIFYGEIYNTASLFPDEPLLAQYTIRDAYTDKVNTNFYKYGKLTSAPVISFLQEMDISDLPGGNYNLVVEVRNKQNELLATKKVFFQRANGGPVNAWENVQMIDIHDTFVSEYTPEQLDYYLDVIRPRASNTETNIIESLSDRVDPVMKQKFLFNFWLQRDSIDPYAAWLAYLDLVKHANEAFKTPSRAGYKTDRGRVYLEYGPPYDVVTSVYESGAYPYEIWFYNTCRINKPI
ncbi:MAG: GWxTD domain-containing protein [Chitinophagales bacterium]